MFKIIPQRRVVRGWPSRRNVKPHDRRVPNVPEVKPQGEVSNVEFGILFKMSSQVVANHTAQ